MCEILLRVRDKESRDTDQRLMQNMAGDVVVVVDDGHQWGDAEMSNPDWRILQLPGLAPEALADMMHARPHWKDGERISARKRFHFDLTDEWLRRVIAAGQVIKLTDVDAARLLGLKRLRVEQSVMVVG